jgi:hypothetical protein
MPTYWKFTYNVYDNIAIRADLMAYESLRGRQLPTLSHAVFPDVEKLKPYIY